jgi:hypothetical protein
MSATSMPDPLAPIQRRLASCVRMLLSANDGERDNAILGIQRTLRSASEAKNVDLHALANRIEGANGAAKNGASGSERFAGLTDELKQYLRAAIDQAHAQGFAEGVMATEAKQHGTGAFRNTDGTLDWKDVALYVQREKHRLRPQTHEFIDDMASRTVWDREPTLKQHQYLHSLFFKLGGKIT